MTGLREGARSAWRLTAARRMVVKIGSALLVNETNGHVRRQWLESVADDVARLHRRGTGVIVVSSGAVAVGRRRLGLASGVARLEEKQAAAAVGQVGLASAYQEVLGRHDITAAQVLLTLGDTENRRRYLNARTTLDTLLKFGVVPVVNENDTVATQELRYGDNDRLGARVALCAGADVLVVLSDIAGLYTADPKGDPSARLIPEVTALTPEIHAMAGKTRSAVGTGGMAAKLKAAQIAMGAGCAVVIAPGKELAPLQRLEDGGPCTWFVAGITPQPARKQWILGAMRAVGSVIVDEGAAQALRSGRSLLPAGVAGVEGDFQRGETVLVRDTMGRLLGKGLAAYDSAAARVIKGHKSTDIERLLGYRGGEELIHRDNLVVE